MAFFDTLKKAAKAAWFDTVMPLASKEQRETRLFKDYFLGAYLGVFAFIPTLVNLVRRPPAFLLNFMSELMYQGRMALESRLGDYASLAFVLVFPEMAFTNASSLFRIVVSPIESLYATQNLINTSWPANDYFALALKIFNFALHLVMASVPLVIVAINVAIPPLWMLLPLGGLLAANFVDIMELSHQGVLFSMWISPFPSTDEPVDWSVLDPAEYARRIRQLRQHEHAAQAAVDTEHAQPISSPEPYEPDNVSAARAAADRVYGNPLSSPESPERVVSVTETDSEPRMSPS